MKKMIYAVIAVLTVVILILGVTALFSRKGASFGKVYDKAKELESREAYLEALALYKEIAEKSQDEELTQKVKKDLSDLNMKILFSPLITEESVPYVVKKGDTLAGIAKNFNTTVELIMKSNGLKSDMIRIGQPLKVSSAKYSVVVDRSQNILTLKSNENVLKTYTVATGINNSTPLGAFKIVNKLINPVWYKAGAIVPSGSPENILGSRWLGLSLSGYGIHGTTDPESIGKQVTAGCVRMFAPDIEELYALLPVGAEVIVVE